MGEVFKIKDMSNEDIINYIFLEACNQMNIDPNVAGMKNRKRELVGCRQRAHFFSKKYTNASLGVIGKNIGNKDHATVLHSCRTVQNLIDTDKRYRDIVTELEIIIEDHLNYMLKKQIEFEKEIESITDIDELRKICYKLHKKLTNNENKKTNIHQEVNS